MTCAEPSDVKNAHKIPARGPYRCGGHVTYLCNHGYTLKGDPTRRCQDNGTFSRRQAVCVEDDDVGGGLRRITLCYVRLNIVRARSQRAKANAIENNMKEPAKDIKEKFRFRIHLV